MSFESLDRYLLEGAGEKGALVKSLLAQPSDLPAAQAFYEGMRLLGPRTPDLSLVALRLVLAGKKAEDDRVVRVRALAEAARKGGPDAPEARTSYFAELT